MCRPNVVAQRTDSKPYQLGALLEPRHGSASSQCDKATFAEMAVPKIATWQHGRTKLSRSRLYVTALCTCLQQSSLGHMLWCHGWTREVAHPEAHHVGVPFLVQRLERVNGVLLAVRAPDEQPGLGVGEPLLHLCRTHPGVSRTAATCIGCGCSGIACVNLNAC